MSKLHGCCEVTYTKAQLDLLRECVRRNDDLSSALLAFVPYLGNHVSVDQIISVWLRFAEQIKSDNDFVEKRFAQRLGDAVKTIVKTDY